MKNVLIYIIKIYQKTLGLYFRGVCRFEPTCSEYMILSIKKYGFLKGLAKGVMRLSHCHPYSKKIGMDEV